jgi:hypothetical protein
LTIRAIRLNVFPGVDHLVDAIVGYLDEHNADPKPFTWTASVESIIEEVLKRRRDHPGYPSAVRIHDAA